MLLQYLQTIISPADWNLCVAVIFFFIGGMVLVGVPSFLYNRHLKQSTHFSQKAKKFYRSLLDAEYWCWWEEGAKTIQCSKGFIQLLGLNGDHLIFLTDIMNQVNSVDTQGLNQHIQNLAQSQIPFETTITLSDEKTLVRVIGHSFQDNGLNTYILNMQEITGEVAVIDHLYAQTKQLSKERDWYEQLINSIPIAIWGRQESLKLSYCNRVYAGIVDLQPYEVLDQQKELIDQQRHNSPYQIAQKALSTKSAQSKRIHVVVDGQRRMIEVTEIPLILGDKFDGTIGYAVDLTDLEEVITTLAKHVSSHQQVLHNLSTPIAVYGADTRLEFFNSAYQKLLGFEERWLHQKPLYVEILQDLRERRKLPEYSDFSAFKRAQLQLFNALIEPIQELINQPDGRILRSMVVPHPLGGLLFMYDDVTDKFAMERRYNTLIAVQKETIDHLYEGIVVLGCDNRLRLSNPAVARLWRVNEIEMEPGRHAGDILFQIRHMFKGYAEWNAFRQQILTLFNLRQPVTERMFLKDQTIVQYSYVPLPDGSHLLGFIDVSDRWRFEQALKERNEALEHADHFKSELIANVSYELRGPLNSIIGFAEILLNQYFGTLNERQVDYCQGISDSSKRLLTLINDIIDFASLEAGHLNLKIQEIQLESFLSSLVGLVYNRSNDHGLQIEYTNNTKVQAFLADERRLKQALFNLLMNAIKFTPSGGKIELISFIEETENAKILCFTVKDNGVGLNDEERLEVFKLFDSSQKAVFSKLKVSAIGLPLVKSFIELHGGWIDIQSSPGNGTSITCHIPLLMENPVTLTKESPEKLRMEKSKSEKRVKGRGQDAPDPMPA